MSRHQVELPVGGPDTSQTIGVVCGYDRHPHEHFFCNVSVSLASDHIDEPIWSSILDDEHDRVSQPDGFDDKLAAMGITLPVFIKEALAEDWVAKDMRRDCRWEPNGELTKEQE